MAHPKDMNESIQLHFLEDLIDKVGDLLSVDTGLLTLEGMEDLVDELKPWFDKHRHKYGD